MDPSAAAVACVVLGFVLLLIEIFLIPGIGFTGLFGAGFICVGGGLVWVEHGMAAGLATLIGSGIVTMFLVWGFWRSGAAGRFILDARVDADSDERVARAKLSGLTGVAITSLRPAGQAEIEGQRYDVVTDGGFVGVGVQVTVIEVEGFRVVVEATPDATNNQEDS